MAVQGHGADGASERMPTYYIPHGGGPCFFMDWDPPDLWTSMANFLRSISGRLPRRPRAILLISAHWETPGFTVGSGAKLPLIYDYYNFPPHTYELTYPAAGDPALAHRVRGLLEEAGLKAVEDPVRGYDHGVFIPLKLMFPDADIPVVQLSLRADYDPAAHLAAGRALATLRDDDVLIVGSGMSFHNLRDMRNPAFLARVQDYAGQFDAWLAETVVGLTGDARNEALTRWASAPAARQAHPPRAEEHLLPLLIAAGAGSDDAGIRVYNDSLMLGRISGFRFG